MSAAPLDPDPSQAQARRLRDPAWYQRVLAVCREAEQHPPPERRAWLERACSGEAALLEDALAFLQRSSTTNTPTAPQRGRHHGREVGGYLLIRRLGEGGFGEVYQGQRPTPPTEAAVKILHRTVRSPAEEARFRREADLLATLDHPNIVRARDFGVTEEGLAFLVIDLVEGLPIDRFCDEKAYDLRQRVALFLQVCAAVQHAHARLVAHCDLKPANILVAQDAADGEARVRLLDFGIARLLGRPPGGDVLGEHGNDPAGTDGYAAPEQFERVPLTTSVDVYGLGVILHELLTGGTPYGLARAGLGYREWMAGLERPLLLSQTLRQRSGPGGRAWRRLRGDLDTIVVRCLQRVPDHRYKNAGELAQDLRACQEGRPLPSRRDQPGYAWYAAACHLQRHWLTAALAAGLAASAVTGAALLWRDRGRLQEANARLSRQAEDLRRMNQEKERALHFNRNLLAAMLDVSAHLSQRADPEALPGEFVRFFSSLLDDLDRKEGTNPFVEWSAQNARLALALQHARHGETQRALALAADAERCCQKLQASKQTPPDMLFPRNLPQELCKGAAGVRIQLTSRSARKSIGFAVSPHGLDQQAFSRSLERLSAALADVGDAHGAAQVASFSARLKARNAVE